MRFITHEIHAHTDIDGTSTVPWQRRGFFRFFHVGTYPGVLVWAVEDRVAGPLTRNVSPFVCLSMIQRSLLAQALPQLPMLRSDAPNRLVVIGGAGVAGHPRVVDGMHVLNDLHVVAVDAIGQLLTTASARTLAYQRQHAERGRWNNPTLRAPPHSHSVYHPYRRISSLFRPWYLENRKRIHQLNQPTTMLSTHQRHESRDKMCAIAASFSFIPVRYVRGTMFAHGLPIQCLAMQVLASLDQGGWFSRAKERAVAHVALSL